MSGLAWYSTTFTPELQPCSVAVMNIPDPSQGISLAQQSAQGFLALPWTPLPIAISTGFSSTLAAVATRDPFIYDATPFDIDQLSKQRFLYVKADSKGKYSSTATTGSTSSQQHTSIAFGVSVGNDYLNAGVTGSYDQSVLENTSVSIPERIYRLGIDTLESKGF